MSKPITPNEVTNKKIENFPALMIEAVNQLIAKHWNGESAHFTQDEVVDLFIDLNLSVNPREPIDRDDVFNNHWLDFEDIFKEIGWKVLYDKPAYCESYDAYFQFRKKKKKKKKHNKAVSH